MLGAQSRGPTFSHRHSSDSIIGLVASECGGTETCDHMWGQGRARSPHSDLCVLSDLKPERFEKTFINALLLLCRIYTNAVRTANSYCVNRYCVRTHCENSYRGKIASRS